MEWWRRRLGAMLGMAVMAGAMLLGLGTASAAAIYAPIDQDQLDRYCRSEGFAQASLTKANAYGWRCTSSGSTGHIPMRKVCQSILPGRVALIDRVSNYHDPYSWKCYQ